MELVEYSSALQPPPPASAKRHSCIYAGKYIAGREGENREGGRRNTKSHLLSHLTPLKNSQGLVSC